MKKPTIVIGVIGADVHAVGNKIIEYILKENGFNVANVGVLSSQEDFINAAIETNAPMILVSSLYGQGELDCRGMRDKCIEAGIPDVILYVGGNIVVGKQAVSYTHLRAHETVLDLVCRLLLEKKK